jgi:hypothetical protein
MLNELCIKNVKSEEDRYVLLSCVEVVVLEYRRIGR